MLKKNLMQQVLPGLAAWQIGMSGRNVYCARLLDQGQVLLRGLFASYSGFTTVYIPACLTTPRHPIHILPRIHYLTLPCLIMLLDTPWYHILVLPDLCYFPWYYIPYSLSYIWPLPKLFCLWIPEWSSPVYLHALSGIFLH